MEKILDGKGIVAYGKKRKYPYIAQASFYYDGMLHVNFFNNTMDWIENTTGVVALWKRKDVKSGTLSANEA